MATSGTHNFTLDVEELINQALKKVGGGVTSGIDLRDARTALNLLLIDLANKGTPLSGLKNAEFPLTQGVKEYVLPAEVSDVLSVVVSRGNVDIPVTRIAIQEYHKISNKEQQGLPTQCMIDRRLLSPVMTLYLVPDDLAASDSINYWYISRIQDAGSYTDTSDISIRYFPALVFGLAYFISFDRDGFDPQKRSELLSNYVGLLENAATEDRERVSFKITPFNYRSR